LLVFGSTDDEHTNIVVENCFDKSFSVKANIDFWKKFGNVPLTRSVLLSNQAGYLVLIEEDGTIDVESDPEALLLNNYEQ